MIKLLFLLNLVWAKTTVGVIDTGIDPDHKIFKDRIDSPATLDQYSGFDSIMDYTGHGTHVSGIVVANTPKEVKILPLKFIDNATMEAANSDPEVRKVLDGFEYETLIKVAIKKGAKIINISGGNQKYSEADYKTIKDNPEVLFVVASGNTTRHSKDGQDLDIPQFLWEQKKLKERYGYFPCGFNLPNIICVGSASVDENKKSVKVYSNYGSQVVDVWANGEKVKSSIPYDEYAELSGSSMATPKITALAATLWEKEPSLKVSELKEKIYGSLKENSELKEKSKTGLYLP